VSNRSFWDENFLWVLRISVAMHLDLKPGNMVYFPKSNWANANAKILKPIDFGSSQILDPNDEPKNRANSSKDDIVLPVGTPHYSAPELKYDTGVVVNWERVLFQADVLTNFKTY
jgi:serine/threonine protein kinase